MRYRAREEARKMRGLVVATFSVSNAGDFSTMSGTIPLNIPVSFGSGVTSQAVTLNITNDGLRHSGEQFRTIVQMMNK